ncbi:EamA family transporter [Intrasporangium sp.]|uniref:EamA family transporter n=1 Tax=Intrasporangium sp. TaxID=1925024 RepID=UPI0029395805|nr:EamA family transporter [Intrasporangium sp.]MDV3221979.1 EamA family transporter [Intrasporangium sp.]
MRPRHAALAILVTAIWGSNFVAIRIGLDDIPPLLFLSIRFVVVCVPAVFFVKRPAIAWRDLALIGIFVSLGQFSLLYIAMHLGMPPGLSSLVLQAQVLFTVVLAALWLRERPSRRQLAGVGVGAAGLAVIAIGRGLTSPLLPLAVVVLGAVSWSIGNVLTRRAGRVSGLQLTVWSGLVVPVPALALSWLVEGPEAMAAGLSAFGWEAAASTAYTAYLASLVGYGIWNTLLSRFPVASVTPFAMLVPVFGMVAAAIAFRERPTLLELLGGVVLLAGVATAVLRRRTSGADAPASGVTAPGRLSEPAAQAGSPSR